MHKTEHINVNENRTQQQAEKYFKIFLKYFWNIFLKYFKISLWSYYWSLLTLFTCRATQWGGKPWLLCVHRTEVPVLVQQQAHKGTWKLYFRSLRNKVLASKGYLIAFIGQGNSTGVLFLVLSAFASCLVYQSGFSQSFSNGTCIIFFDMPIQNIRQG